MCLATCMIVAGFAAMAFADDDRPYAPGSKEAKLRTQFICNANAAYDAAVAAADANWRAATWGKRKERATTKEKLAALRAAQCARTCAVESAAIARRAAYVKAYAIVPLDEPKTPEEHYLATIREVGAEIEKEYRADLEGARNAKTIAEREATIAVAKQIRTERYNMLRAYYFLRRPQNCW